MPVTKNSSHMVLELGWNVTPSHEILRPRKQIRNSGLKYCQTLYVASDVHARAYDAHRQRLRLQYSESGTPIWNLGLENQISANVEKHVACPQSCVRSWLSIALIIWYINSFCLIRWCLEIWSPDHVEVTHRRLCARMAWKLFSSGIRYCRQHKEWCGWTAAVAMNAVGNITSSRGKRMNDGQSRWRCSLGPFKLNVSSIMNNNGFFSMNQSIVFVSHVECVLKWPSSFTYNHPCSTLSVIKQ